MILIREWLSLFQAPFPKSRAHIFACLSLTRHPHYQSAWKTLGMAQKITLCVCKAQKRYLNIRLITSQELQGEWLHGAGIGWHGF